MSSTCVCLQRTEAYLFLHEEQLPVWLCWQKKKPLLPLGKSVLPLKLATHLLSALREGRAAAWLVMVKITARSCQEDVPSTVVSADLRTGDRRVHTGTREMLPWDFMLRLRKFCNVQNDMGMIL